MSPNLIFPAPPDEPALTGGFFISAPRVTPKRGNRLAGNAQLSQIPRQLGYMPMQTTETPYPRAQVVKTRLTEAAHAPVNARTLSGREPVTSPDADR
jgi:hypothetical protein